MEQKPVANKAEIETRLKSHAEHLKDFGVERLGLFGSFARSEAGPDSDVDLYLEIAAEYKTLKNMLALTQFLRELLGRKVDIVTPASLNPFIGKHILKEVSYVALAA